MQREIIRVEPIDSNFEKWGAPVSTCTRAGNMVFVSGMPPFDPETGEILVHAPFERQVELILEQVKKALEAAGSDLDHVLKCNVLCISADRFKAFNEVYKRYFPKNPQPASSSACLSGPGPSTSRSIAWRSRRTDLGRQQLAGAEGIWARVIYPPLNGFLKRSLSYLLLPRAPPGVGFVFLSNCNSCRLALDGSSGQRWRG